MSHYRQTGASRGGKRGDGIGHPRQEIIQRVKLQKLHFPMLQLDPSSYCSCKATDPRCMDLMGTSLRWTCKCMRPERERDEALPSLI